MVSFSVAIPARATPALARALAAALFVLVLGGQRPALAVAPSSAPTASQPPQAPPPAATPQPAAVAPVVASDTPQTMLSELANRAPTTSNDAELATMAGQAAAIDAQARGEAAQDLARINAARRAIRAIAPPGRRDLDPAARAKLAPLQAHLGQALGQYRRAQATTVAAGGVYSVIAERRREGFTARLLQRSASPLTPAFWTAIAADASGDLGRLDASVDDEAATALEAPEPQAAIGIAIAAAVGLLLALPLRRELDRLGRRKAGEGVQPGLARTGAALWVAAVDTGAPTLAAAILRLGAQWSRLLSDDADAMAGAVVAAIAWAAVILALGRVLATDRDAPQRLLGLSDDVAKRLRAPLVAVALVNAGGYLLTRLNDVVGASVAATIAADGLVSLAYAAVAGLILVSFGRQRATPNADDDSVATVGASAWTLISLGLSAAVGVTVVGVLAGYTTLAAVVANQLFWLGVIAAVAYVLVRFVDDLCTALFKERGWAARTLFLLFSLRRSTIRQAGVLLSAAVQLTIFLGALSLALTPFGQSGDRLFADVSRFGATIRIGSASISPVATAGGLVILFVGVGVVHAVQAWVRRRYLPVTDWDAGVRDSVTTGVGYIGVAVAVIVAASAMGLSFTQIALLASALSVGIGFGLQQVVQNFIAGLIVLIERPVKVGDWVNIDGVEGDIRRIRVRATEIQTFDRSTVIVPNSDLITKSVLNKTIGNPRGRIELTISIANAADAEKVRALVLGTAKTDKRVLEDPPPALYIDSIAAGGVVNFTSYLYVSNPRDVRKVKSELYFEVLARFQQEKIAFPSA
jgi:potassium-dependent mechanosensitive channel